MGEVKKRNPMENSNIKYMVMTNLIISLLLLFSCNDKKQEILEKKNISLQKEEIVSNIFVPDSIINSVLKLRDENSSSKFYSSINTIKLIDLVAEHPVKVFLNNSKTEYLLAYNYEGDIENSFSCFEIGVINNSYSKIATKTDFGNFETQSGIKLGITLEQLKKIKGINYIVKDDLIIYELSDFNNSAFLQKYNMPYYFIECKFVKEKLVKLKFGFSYP